MPIFTLISVILIAIVLVSGYIFLEYIKLKNKTNTKLATSEGFEADKIKEIKLIAETKNVSNIAKREELFKKSYERKFLNNTNYNAEQKELKCEQAINNRIPIKEQKTNTENTNFYNNTDIEYLDALLFTSRNIYLDKNI